MDNRVKTALTLICLAFVVRFSFVFCDSIQWTKYDYKGETNGRCIQDATVFETEAQDALSCGKMCHLESVCESFVYHPSVQRCLGCRYKYDDTPAQENVKTYSAPISFIKAEIIESDCLQILRNRPNAQSNKYEIRLWKSKKKIEVYCDMDTDGGGWTVFQNRFHGRVDFYRNFSEYEDGFGSLDGEFWLGSLHFEALHGFLASSGNSFSTFDHDYDGSEGNCAEDAGGWWYGGENCGLVNLNDAYPDQDELVNPEVFDLRRRGFKHFGFAGISFLKTSRIMVRRLDIHPHYTGI